MHRVFGAGQAGDGVLGFQITRRDGGRRSWPDFPARADRGKQPTDFAIEIETGDDPFKSGRPAASRCWRVDKASILCPVRSPEGTRHGRGRSRWIVEKLEEAGLHAVPTSVRIGPCYP